MIFFDADSPQKFQVFIYSKVLQIISAQWLKTKNYWRIKFSIWFENNHYFFSFLNLRYVVHKYQYYIRATSFHSEPNKKSTFPPKSTKCIALWNNGLLKDLWLEQILTLSPRMRQKMKQIIFLIFFQRQSGPGHLKKSKWTKNFWPI